MTTGDDPCCCQAIAKACAVAKAEDPDVPTFATESELVGALVALLARARKAELARDTAGVEGGTDETGNRERVKRLVRAVRSMQVLQPLMDMLAKESKDGSAAGIVKDCNDGTSWSDAHWVAEEYVAVLAQVSRNNLAARTRGVSSVLQELAAEHLAADPATTAEGPAERAQNVLQLLATA